MPFSLNDPLFDVDIGFYVFRLPMLLKIHNWLTFVLTFALLASAAVCLLYRGIIYGPRGVVFSAREATTPAAPVETANGGRDLARQALDHFQRSQERLRQGNWGGYGEELKKLETLLRQMQPGR